MRLHNEVRSTVPDSVPIPPEKTTDACARTMSSRGGAADLAPSPPQSAPRKNALHPTQKYLISTLPAKRDSAPTENRKTPSGPSRFDKGRIASNAAMAGVSVASTFGALSALNNIARIHPNTLIKAAGTCAPVAAGMASAFVAQAIQDTFDVKTTAAGSASLARDAATPLSFVVTSYAYLMSNLPKFAPKTPAGVGATVAVSAIGAGVGGGIAEMIAQKIPASAEHLTPKDHVPPTTFQVGTGRSITQIPAMALNTVIAAMSTKGPISPLLAKAVPMAVGVPFIFRKAVTPTSDMPGASQPTAAEVQAQVEAGSKRP